MTTLFIGIFFGVLAIGGGVWYFTVFARANPPLPRANVTVQRATATTTSTSTAASPTVSSPAPTSTTAKTSSTATTTISHADPSMVYPTSSYQAEQLSVDGARFNVEVASTMIQQARGLSYRASLGEDDGMLFIFGSAGTQAFWMKDMNFPLDMIWISGNTVVGFAQNAPAQPGVLVPTQIFSSPSSTDKVLEVNAGTVAKYNIKIGDTVTIGAIGKQ